MSHQSLTNNSESRQERACAKLNLGLKILSRRQDGFHDLLSVFQTVSLCDTIRVTLATDITLNCSDPTLPTGAENLAWRAADLYHREVGGDGCHIELTKRIPAGGGLGGGSADAATQASPGRDPFGLSTGSPPNPWDLGDWRSWAPTSVRTCLSRCAAGSC